MSDTEHTHEAVHHPPSGQGYQVCWCGATRPVDKGKPWGGWHECELCVLPAFRTNKR